MASRDFLGRFSGEETPPENGGSLAGGGGGGESDDIELSLGLSLGGCFGFDPRDPKKPRLVRSSSIASLCSLPGGAADDFPAVAAAAAVPLMRTSSLPTETEEERWRRREMQSLKRLEAKRKRLERKSSMNSVKSGATAASAAPGKEEGPEMPILSVNGFPPMSQGSVGSQGSSSASVPEQGLDVGGGIGHSVEVGSPSTIKPSPDNANHNTPLPPTTATGKALNGTMTEQSPLRTLRSLTMRTSSTGDISKSMMEDMPMVSSKVEGPNGRRIDGFLYKYRKGEEVRIVCVCHGNFLTPAEFVKHAGGGDVTNPLRHIVVNPSPSVFL